MKKFRFLSAFLIITFTTPIIYAQIKTQQKNPRPIKISYPAYSILEAEYNGSIEDKNITIKSKFKISILEEKNISIPILYKDAAIIKADIPKNVLLSVNDNWYSLIFMKKGDYNITLLFTSKITKKEDRNIFNFKPPDSAISTLTLTIPGTGLDIKINPPLSMRTKKINNKETELTAFLGTNKNIEIEWASKASALTAAKPMFLSENNMLVNISPGIIKFSSIFNYKIMQGKISKFTVNFPIDINLLTVKGENLKNWNLKQNKTKQILEIELSKEITDDYKLILEMEKTKDETSGLFDIPEIITLNAERQTGFIAIAATENLKIRPIKRLGINQIDYSQLPEELIKKTTNGISLAYKYLNQPILLSLNLERIKSEISVRNNLFFQINEDFINLHAVIDYTIKKAGIFNLSIDLPNSLSITDVTGSDIETWSTSKNENFQRLEVQLRNKVIGNYKLNINMENPIKNIDDIYKGIDIPQVKIINVNKTIGYIGVSCVSNIKISTKYRNNLAEVDINELHLPSKKIITPPTLAYKYIEEPYVLQLNAEKVDPRVTAKAFTFLSVGEGLLLVNSAVTYDILYAGIDKFTISFPEDVQAVEITGKNIKSKDEIKKKINGKKVKEKNWNVRLHSKVKGPYTLYCSYEKLMKDTSGKVNLPKLKVLNVERESGYYCLGPRTNVEIKPDLISAASQIDIKELPQDKIKGIDVPLVLAFKYVKHPYDIVVDIKKHEDVSVLVAISESAQITSVLTRDGQIMHHALYTIKNRQKQYLNVALPKNANIMSIFVNNKPVKAGKTKDGTILIPLEKFQDKERIYPVEIVYETKRPKLNFFGRLKLTQPQLDIPSTNINWKVYLPENYTYFKFSGNIELTKHKHPSIMGWGKKSSRTKRHQERYEMNKPPAPASGIYQAYEGAALREPKERLRYKSIPKKEKRSKFRDMRDKFDMTNQMLEEKDQEFISNIQSQVRTYQQRVEPQIMQIKKGKLTGVLPIKIQIPTGGILFTFNKLFSNDELVQVKTLYKKGSLNYFWVLFILFCVILFINRNKILNMFRSRNNTHD